MATNLDLDDALIEEAVKVGKHKTKKEAVTAALLEYIKRRGRLGILQLEGKIDYDPRYDYKTARKKEARVNVLVDTSVWSLLLRRRQSARLSTRQAAAVQELKELVREDRAQLTGVIRQELLTGIRSDVEFEELKSWLRFYDDLPADFETHELAAQYANQCLGTGIVTSAIDILICAIAMKHQLPVFTLDDGFRKIQSVVPITFHVAK